MTCVATGVVVLWGLDHGRSGDEYECGECGNKTIHANNESHRVSHLSAAALEARGYLREMN
jgi:predicted RNA-binding Zn-ribbon protein involved in translation (DUF1610 family)